VKTYPFAKAHGSESFCWLPLPGAEFQEEERQQERGEEEDFYFRDNSS
jgi:hypothetical protein